MRGFGKRRVIVVLADGARLANVGCVDNAHAGMPATGPQTVALAQRVMEPMLTSGPGRFLALTDMLTGHPPARHLLRFCRIADIVVDEDVSDISGHLGRDVSVVRVHVEAVHAAPVRALVRDE